ncbi:MAG TPA: amidohydrolase [Candidatus Cloacimonadota bacterium]|nr:amidohydrolase [Candidatus Cloacimonadota bacterium]HPS38663.1 amidohydrolase [Candidatus Cloacimonadota bacterium]
MNYVFVNAKVLDASCTKLETGKSVLVTNNTIKHIGQLSECIALSPKTPEIIDLRGKVLLPAFTDVHTHFVEYAKRRIMIDLSGLTKISDVEAALNRYRDEQDHLPDWIQGGGWDLNYLDDPSGLNCLLLDKVFPDIPVTLFSKDYHGRLCNSLALRKAGINAKTPDPAGGRYSRFADGSPSGLAYEAAAESIDRHVKQPEARQLRFTLKASIEAAQNLGLAGVHSMEGTQSWSLLEEARRGCANFRFTWHFPLDELDNMINHHVQSYTGSERLKIGGVKLFADGALGSQTAAMFTPYPSTGSNGILRYSDYELSEIGEHAASNGIALTVHAIGNRAVHQVLQLFSRLNDTFPGLLHRIEHLQSIRKADLKLLKGSGAYCSLQPVHLANDIPLIRQHWNNVEDQAYRFRDISNNCNGLGFGSDAPIESMNPCLGIYSLLKRKQFLDPTCESWMPEQSLGVFEALHGYTIGAAKGSNSDHIRGSIESGFYADLQVFEDFSAEPDEFWLEAKPLLLMVDGVIVYDHCE